VEHDAREIWANTLDVIASGLRKSGLSSSDISALGITNQRETSLLWNRKTGAPYGNAIVWQDTRTDEICRDLQNKSGSEMIKKKTGLPINTYFSGPKIKWLLDHSPEAREDAQKGLVAFGTMDTWLIWNLTGGTQGGVHVTDVTNASRTLLMNLETLNWDDELLQMLGIPASILPRICSSAEVYGYSRTILPDVPICGDLGDQQAALFGQACFNPR